MKKIIIVLLCVFRLIECGEQTSEVNDSELLINRDLMILRKEACDTNIFEGTASLFAMMALIKACNEGTWIFTTSEEIANKLAPFTYPAKGAPLRPNQNTCKALAKMANPNQESNDK